MYKIQIAKVLFGKSYPFAMELIEIDLVEIKLLKLDVLTNRLLVIFDSIIKNNNNNKLE